MAEKFINIKYPFKDSNKGYFIDMNKTDNEAIKSDLMHLILTKKGERLYNPEFGTNLMTYIFEPNDNLTFANIKEEISDTVKRYIPELNLGEVSLERINDNEHVAILTIEYTISDGVFKSKDIVKIKI